MPRWVKLSENIAEDLTIADMLSNGAETRAALLFLMSLPRADLYGVLPGSPRLFKARVCPVARTGEKTIERALALLVDRGLVTPFINKGQQHLVITNYHKYQDVRWKNYVGPPKVKMPEDWQPPEQLITWLKTLEPEKRAPYLENIPILDPTTVELRSSTENYGPDVDVDVDVDVDADKNDKGAPEKFSGRHKDETAKQFRQRKLSEKAELLSEFTPTERDFVDNLLQIADEETKRGKTPGGQVSWLMRVLDIASEIDNGDGFLYGLQAACDAEAPNANYVKKAALGWLRKHGDNITA